MHIEYTAGVRFTRRHEITAEKDVGKKDDGRHITSSMLNKSYSYHDVQIRVALINIHSTNSGIVGKETLLKMKRSTTFIQICSATANKRPKEMRIFNQKYIKDV